MTNLDNDATEMVAPQDNADLFTRWQPFFKNYAVKRGIHPNDVQDAASIMVLRHIERDTIHNFDGDRVTNYKGEQRPARFKTYLGRAIELDLRGIRDKNSRIAARELAVGCIESRSENDSSNTVPWLDAIGDVQEDHADAIDDMIDYEAEIKYLRIKLSELPRRNVQDLCDLVALHDVICKQILDDGAYDIPKLAAKFDIASTTMHHWVRYWKSCIAAIYNRPLPPKRARRSRKDTP